VNGGFAMGTAEQVGDAYAWMLDEGHTDDQVGLAAWVSAHPSLVAADENSVIIQNHYWLDALSEPDQRGAGAFFVHYVGSKDWTMLYSYGADVARFAGPYGIAVEDYSNSRWPWKAVALGLALVLLLISFKAGWAFRGARRRR
jgi:hypothetical protein